MKLFMSALPNCVFLILTVVSATQAVTIDSSVERDVFHSASAAGNLFSQNFDAIASGTTVNTINGVTYSASQGNAVVTSDFLATTPPNGLGSTSFGYFGPTESAVISFAAVITAFAIDINTFAPNSGDYVATLNIGSTINSRPVYFGGSSFGEFFGFTSDTPFTSVTIRASAGGDALLPYTLDTLIFGEASNLRAAIPEPSTWILLAIGLGLLFAWRTTVPRLPAFKIHARHRSPHAFREGRGNRTPGHCTRAIRNSLRTTGSRPDAQLFAFKCGLELRRSRI